MTPAVKTLKMNLGKVMIKDSSPAPFIVGHPEPEK